jgi:two-component system chemotaxis response regulator CheY
LRFFLTPDFTGASVPAPSLAFRDATQTRGPLRVLEVPAMAADLAMPILVVDDYATMLRIIRNLLRQIGFENVDDAMDGTQALDMLSRKTYGLVISDWNMEPMTGYELLKVVRARNDTARLPFIMVTAESKTENVIAAKKAGVNNYIVKPFNAETLKGKINTVFGE